MSLLPSIRLVSPIYTETNSVDATSDISAYFSPDTKYFYTYIGAGTNLNLKYYVTTDGETPAVGQNIALQVNAPYSGSNANWVSGTTVISAQTDDTYTVEINGVTDDSGHVTFEVTNTDVDGLENAPDSLTQDRSAITPAPLQGTMRPIYPGKNNTDADIDIITFHIVNLYPISTEVGTI